MATQEIDRRCYKERIKAAIADDRVLDVLGLQAGVGRV